MHTSPLLNVTMYQLLHLQNMSNTQCHFQAEPERCLTAPPPLPSTRWKADARLNLGHADNSNYLVKAKKQGERSWVSTV